MEFPEEDEDELRFMQQIPLMNKKVMIMRNNDSDKDDLNHVDKKMKTTVTDSNQINNNTVTIKEDDPVTKAKALTKAQLIQLLGDLSMDNEEVRDKLRSLMPRPDISGLVSTLTYHMHNIHRSIPQSRLSSHTDSYRCHNNIVF